MLHRILPSFVLACVLAVVTSSVWACAICAPSDAEQTLTQRLYKSEGIALGQALSAAGAYRVTTPVRGVGAGENLVGVVLAQGIAAPVSGASVLLAQSGGTWRVMALLPADRAAWVQKLVALRRPPDANPALADWPVRFAFFVPDLESPVAAVAQVAYEELAVAPYGAMRAASHSYADLPLWQWLSRPKLVDRHPLYALMAGFIARPEQAADIQSHLLRSSARVPLPSSSAWMAALLEVQGPTGLAWLTQHYFQDSSRTDTEVQSALLALRVHVADGGQLGKSAAVPALRTFVRANPHRAGFAASDLGDWAQWDFIEDFERLLDTESPQVFASRYAMVLYLLRNPRAEAQAALQRLRAKGRL